MNDVPAQRILHVLVPIIAVKAVRRLVRFEFVYLGSDRSILGVSGFTPSMHAAWSLRHREHGAAAHEILVAESQARRSVRVVSGALAAVVRWSVPGVALVQRRAL
jgi:hypothetical protein